jgi:hypothetical protein
MLLELLRDVHLSVSHLGCVESSRSKEVLPGSILFRVFEMLDTAPGISEVKGGRFTYCAGEA